MAWTFEATKAGYRKLWQQAEIRAEDRDETTAAANKIIANEDRYKQIEKATGVPWFWIGAIHNREASNSFAGVLHNGEKIIGTGQKTSLVPAGRGPFATWEEAAIDALKLKNLDDIDDWPVEMMLFQSEIYNGLGYIGKKINSPYVWAGTSLQQRGKYTSDHGFDPSVWDTQLGVAAMLKRLGEMRPDIAKALATEPEVMPMPSPMQPMPQPAGNEMWQQVFQLLIPLLIQLLQSKLSPQSPPIVNVTPQVSTPQMQIPAGADSLAQRPSVGLGTLLTGLIGGLQGMGTMSPPNTLSGFLSLAIPAAFTILSATTPGGATGIATGLVGVLGRLFAKGK